MLDGKNKYTTCRITIFKEKNTEDWESYQSGMDENNVCITMSGTNALLNVFMTTVDPEKRIDSRATFRCMDQMLACGGEDKYYPVNLKTNLFQVFQIWKT